ncbi:MAG TPA: NAD(P)H-hydrate dehydratase [Kofleriaceae bacterium]|jgi:NAD(P)H-hydrate epimerase|nr:NAD(P)H-hydrate dehydratase [Kofleriaceae bacterium]
MKPVVTAAEMRALDRATIDDVGIPAFTLMETAGRGVAEVAMQTISWSRTDRVAVVCGPGNNGGDGFVAARVLLGHDIDACAYLTVPRDKIKGDASAHLAILERAGGIVRMADTPERLDTVRDEIEHAALVIDAVFGIGLERTIEGHFAEVIATINRARERLALDIPSGLHTDTGRTLGVAVDAQRTVTMAALKPALAGAPGFARAGQIDVIDIGVPPGVLATQGVCAGLVEDRDVASWLPKIAAMDHKGTRGHVLVIGGMPGMRGAGRLASIAALRAGAGLVTLASADDPTADDSVMTRSISGDLGSVLERKAAILIGPGLGTSAEAQRWVDQVLACGVPAVLDADALRDPAAIAKAAGPIVITPHPGEAARLLGTTADAIEADRFAAARALAAKTRAVVVLKGARTIVCDGTLRDDFCSINPTGGPSLGTGGSGDVLAGAIAALLAQQLSPHDAARAAVFVHGRAGDNLANIHGERGVVSSDLPLAIAGALREIPRPA